jgi:hypothetical protein
MGNPWPGYYTQTLISIFELLQYDAAARDE